MNESQQTVTPPPMDSEINLRELFNIVWAGKWLISAITLSAVAIAVVVALILPNIYRAEALVAPNHEQNAGGLSALASQYGGLAGLAGLDFGTGTGASHKTDLALEVLKSRKFVAQFIERHGILVPLMAANGWDSSTDELTYDRDVYDPVQDQWVRSVRPPREVIPSSQEAYEEFRECLFVSQSTDSSFVRIAIEFYSPNVAKQWVDWLVEDINTTIMLREVSEAEQAIAYLNDQVASTSLADLKSVFFRLIEEQTKTVVLAKVSTEYMFRTVDPAVAPELKAKPKRTIIVLLAAMLSGMLAIAIVLLRNKFSIDQ